MYYSEGIHLYGADFVGVNEHLSESICGVILPCSPVVVLVLISCMILVPPDSRCFFFLWTNRVFALCNCSETPHVVVYGCCHLDFQ